MLFSKLFGLRRPLRLRLLFPPPILLLNLPRSYVDAAFTEPLCWNENCVQKNENATFCYYPHVGETTATTCNQAPDLESIINAHFAQGLSIAYYGLDATRLGGANYSVPPNSGVTSLCLSGQAGDGSYQTTCTDVNADNSITSGDGIICQVALGQKMVDDGCYPPMNSSYVPPRPQTKRRRCCRCACRSCCETFGIVLAGIIFLSILGGAGYQGRGYIRTTYERAW